MSVIKDNKDVPYVAVWMITYNHENYIRQTIEGVLMQKTDFSVKLFIGEDCSTDNTRNICLEYVDRYPDQIELMSTKQNDIRLNVDNLWKATITSGAKYIAMCDGDDYWTSPDKLQKQVDFLNAHPDFSMCFTDVDVVDEIGLHSPYSFVRSDKNELSIEDIVTTEKAPVPTSTLLLRNTIEYPLPSFYMNTKVGDHALIILLADKGKAMIMHEKTAIYRQHSGGFTQTKFFQENEYQIVYKLYEEVNKYFDYKYNDIFAKRLLEVSRTILIYGSRNKTGMEKFKYAMKNFSKYFKYSKPINIKETAYYLAILFFPTVLKLKR